MKATGIVRRIDDLGRIVIPKEIRKTLKVKEGMPLEIFTDQDGVIVLKKYTDQSVFLIEKVAHYQRVCLSLPRILASGRYLLHKSSPG